MTPRGGPPMLHPVRIRRLIAATLVCAALVLGVSTLIGSGRAEATGGGPVVHTCSVTDRQFLQTVQSNMTELGYWSDQLQQDEATPGLVVKQALSESRQVETTAPSDPSLKTARSLLRKMFTEYGAAVRAKAAGRSPGLHVQTAYQLANAVHDLLVDAQPEMSAKGCDLMPLLQA